MLILLFFLSFINGHVMEIEPGQWQPTFEYMQHPLFPEIDQLDSTHFHDPDDNDCIQQDNQLGNKTEINESSSPQKRKQSFCEKNSKKQKREETADNFSVVDPNKGVKCDHCSEQLIKNPHSIKAHWQLKHPEEFKKRYPIPCIDENCKDHFSRWGNFSQHLIKQHKIGKSNAIAQKKELLKKLHTTKETSLPKKTVRRLHAKIKRRNCPECKKVHTNTRSFKSHLMECNFNFYQIIFPHSCALCLDDFQNPIKLEKHRCVPQPKINTANKIGSKGYYKANGAKVMEYYCRNKHKEKTFHDPYAFKNHLRTCDEKKLNELFPFTCEHCDTSLKSAKWLNLHLEHRTINGECRTKSH